MSQTPIVAIVIGRSNSWCSACKRSALPDLKTHDVNVSCGYDGRYGCGATFTHVTTDCTGAGIELTTADMRKDLPWIDFGSVPRR